MKSVIYAGSVVALTAIISIFGFSNPDTPAGQVGYCTKGAIFGKAHFHSLQTGPTSTGLGWFLGCTNVSVTPYTYDVVFAVAKDGRDEAMVAHDKLKVQFTVHIPWNIRHDRVQDFIENYAVVGGETDPDKIAAASFHHFIDAVLRTYTRQEIEKYDGLKIKDHQGDISVNLTALMQAYTNDTPFEVGQINVGAIQPPQNVLNEIAKVRQMGQQVAQKDEQIKQKREDKRSRVAEARGIKKSMDELNATLTDEYLQWEAIKVQQAAKNSPNHRTIYIYNGLPVTGTVGVASPAAPK